MKKDSDQKFGFMHEEDPYNKYYNQMLNIAKEKEELKEKANKEKENNINDNNDNYIGQKREREPTNKISNNVLQNDLRKILNSNNEILSISAGKNTIESLKDIKPPKPEQFSVSHPNISTYQMDVIKLTAQFVARNGQSFLSELTERESRNSQFDFLKPQHNLFGYFTYLVGSYSKVIANKKGKIEDYATDYNNIIKDANNRVLYDRKMKKMQKNKNFNEEDLLNEQERKSR